jgi:type III secretory pathway component EscU
MFRKNKFKLITMYIIFGMSYDLTKTFSQNVSFSLAYSLISAVVFGFLIGGILDYKSNKRREIRNLNKNIEEFKKNNLQNQSINKDDIIGKIERLNKLKNDKSITEEEYQKLKGQLFNNYKN